MSSRSLLLPVETLNRELDGKLLLALHAAKRGWQTTVGKRSLLHENLPHFSRSIYLSKGIRSGNKIVFRSLAGLGHTIVGLDEEGLVGVSDEMFLLKMDPEVIGRLQATFAWGENDARIYRLAGERMAGKPVIVTGNPRVDLLRPELAGYFSDEVTKIRASYGRFALLNTNFAMVNHFIANQTRFKVADWVSDGKADQMKSGMLGHKAKLLASFLELIPRLAEALHPIPLIIRPHPSENRQTWADAASGIENVHVLHEGNVASWLTAAQVLIHNGCTSAVEAAIIGTQALSYRPVNQPEFDNDLPNDLSHNFETAPALIAETVKILGEPREGRHQLDSGRCAVLDNYISALNGPLACERLMDEIERCHESPKPPPGLPRRLIERIRIARRNTRRRNKKRSIMAKGNPTYLRHKFPPISLAEVNERINRLKESLEGFEEFKAEEIMPDLFRIVRGKT